MTEHKNSVTIADIAALLQEKSEFLILCHTNPDEDTVGSAYALCAALVKLGKTAVIACDALPDDRARGYVNTDVFVTPQAGEPFDLTPYERAYVISVDVASRNMLGGLSLLFEGKVDLKIDHHAIGEDFGKDNYTDTESGACGMILYEIIDTLGVWDEKIASSLYMAITSDTGGFRYSNTTAKTHRIAADLLEKGADGAGVSEALFETKKQRDFRALQLGLSHMRYLCDGLVALIAISNADKEAAGVDDHDLSELSAISRQTEGVILGIVLKQSDGDSRRYKLSCRSREGFDAAALCAHFGGGGHTRAAGGAIYADSLQAAEKQLLDVVYPMIGALDS